MSDTDSFIEEVTEEVRRDRLFKYVRQFGWIAVVLVIGVVGGTVYLEWQKAKSAATAQALGDSVIAALNSDDADGRAKALGALAPEAGDAQIIVELRQAGELVEAGNTDAALVVYDAIASGNGDAIYKDMARFKAVMLRGADQDIATRDVALADLAAPGHPFRPLALEQQANFALKDGNRDQAVALFSEIFEDDAATDGLRSRATQMLVALGADLPSNPQLLSE